MRNVLAAALATVAVAAWPALGAAASHSSGGGGSHSGGSSSHSSGSSHSSSGSHSSSSGHASSSAHASGSVIARPGTHGFPSGLAPHPRPGTGTGFFPGRGFGRGFGFGSPFFGFGLGLGLGYPYLGYGYGYPYGYPYGFGYGSYGYPYSDYYGGGGSYYGPSYAPSYGMEYGGGGSDETYNGGGYADDRRPGGGIRLLVDPTDAQVIVDGKYFGVVDDFNGSTRHLQLSSGRHEVVLKKDGYKTHRIDVYVAPGELLKVRYDMERGSGEDPADTLSRGPAPYATPQASRRGGPAADEGVQMTPSAGGSVSLAIQPRDATIYVDGEFRGSARDLPSLDLPEGRHRVEVMRPGYKTFTRELDVDSGAPSSISISLDRP